ISDSAEEIEEKCRKAVSDTNSQLSYDPQARPAISNLIDLYCAVTGSEISTVVESDWDQFDLKMQLSRAVAKKFLPIREKLLMLERDNELCTLIY
ncbi:hypothetical protein Angca_003876, partial [Angiostrongylus cantonensis]